MAVEQHDVFNAKGGKAVTPSDTLVLEPMARALWIGAEGDIAVEGPDETTVTYRNVPVGLLNVQAVRVLATGTTAGDIVSMH